MMEFHVVPGVAVSDILAESRPLILEIVKEVYLMHEQGLTVNPDSCFLHLPGKPTSRVIALPAYLNGTVEKIGIKWIASFPHNIRSGKPRASAVLLLNDPEAGLPIACLEAAGISAARTAASAAVATSALVPSDQSVTVAFVGAGVIARAIVDYLAAAGSNVAEVLVHDKDRASADRLVTYTNTRLGSPTTRGDTLAEALKRDVVVFATTALEPYVSADTQLIPGQVLINISLRDLAPELLLTANNVLDDVEHCLKARTSPHLAEQLSGSRHFVTGTIRGLLRGEVTLDPTRHTVFSPFGLGGLDVAVGSHVLGEALDRRLTVPIPGFIGETSRW
jgi:2,3-diaminopropionate biosynthesis protein SbnB